MKQKLFEKVIFTSHSGKKLLFKIDCDALTNEDIECIAEFIASKTEFGVVDGIPRGGIRLANALEKYAVIDAPFNYLIVDDVFTTGTSMEAHKAKLSPLINPNDVVGWVIFARGKLPLWINAMFQLYSDA